MDNRAGAVLKTLLYSDIFDYPLKKEEVWKYLIADKKIPQKTVFYSLDFLKTERIIATKGGYFFLKGRQANVLKRRERGVISVQKKIIAEKIIRSLAFLPFIKFIGISGALSMENSDRDDDIDIFVITKKHFVWTARFFLILALNALGVYRRREARSYKDKICLNLILDEENLRFIDNNIYVAHEIAQLVPVVDKDGTYRKFINANKWVSGFLPNVFEKKQVYFKIRTRFIDKLIVLSAKLLMFENIFRFLEFQYMKKHITKEEIREGFLSFHPFDYKVYVIKSYQKKIKNSGLK